MEDENELAKSMDKIHSIAFLSIDEHCGLIE
jgi:hypothetical protein